MTSEDRQEIDTLLAEQARLRNAVAQIEKRVKRIVERLEKSAEPAEVPHPVAPPPLPPVLPKPPAAPAPPPQGPATVERVDPLPEPAPEPERVPPVAAFGPESPSSPLKNEPPVRPAFVGWPPKEPASPDPARPRESLELRLGTFWLPIAGIVIFVTGLVFLGNYAWHLFIHRLGAGGKLALIYLAGFALGGLGLWLGRKRQELRNYSRMLAAGGAATIYYATYAAHYVSALRVIESPVLGGTLLLGLAGGFTWWAHRQRSQTIAVLAILLAYYTAAINAIGVFTLFSNVLLTAAAVFFLVRHRWAIVSWAALVGTYASFGFWRWHHAHDPANAGLALPDDFRLSIAFTLCYWLLFTGAALFATAEALPPKRRVAFLTLNNGAFFAFAAEQFSVHWPDAFWAFSAGFGVVLLGLAALSFKRRPEEHPIDGAYLAQGLAFLTIGILAKITGPHLAITLAVESALLLTGARSRHRKIFQIAGLLAAGLAFFSAIDAAHGLPANSARLVKGAVAGILIFDAWWLKKQRGTLEANRFEWRAFVFASPGLFLIGSMIPLDASAAWAPGAFALAAVLCTASLYAIRLPEVALTGQLFLAVGVMLWIDEHRGGTAEPWWCPLPLVLASLALAHWWQRQQTLKVEGEPRSILQVVFSACLVGLGVVWMWPHFQGDALLIATTAAAVGALAYGLLTGAWAVALLGQAFAVISCGLFLYSLGDGDAHWLFALVPIAGLGVTAIVASTLASRRFPTAGHPGLYPEVAFVYRSLAMVLLGLWGKEYVPEEWRFLFFAGFGSAMALAGALTRSRERAVTGVSFASVGFIFYWLRLGSPVWFADLAAIVIFPAALRAGRPSLKDADSTTDVVVTTFAGVAAASLWLWVTQWTLVHYDSAMLTVAWALAAPVVFAAGLSLRERAYRLAGFIMLALAVGRVFLVDVWRLETIFRIVSFLVLGVVLLALGFVYNRYAETIKKWL